MQRTSLAFPARAIQRKRIHRLSTRRLALAWGAALTLAGCGSSGGGRSGDFVLSALPTSGCVEDTSSLTCKISPNAQQTMTFVLTQGGQPAAGQTVLFAIVAAPMSASTQGATVGAPTGVTDAKGQVAVSVRAGLAPFGLQAQYGSAETKEVAFVVTTGPTATVLVAPFLVPSASPLPAGTTIEIRFYDQESCDHINLDQPDMPVRTIATLTSLSAPPAQFSLVDTMVVSSAVGQAISGTGVVAEGCVDIPGSSLVAGQPVQVSLPLSDAFPDPVGTYHVTSTLTFAPPLAAAATLASPWADLSDCPLDPAQLWLDCTVDALSPATAADPLDCIPATAPGAEGALGDTIASLRGVLLTDGNGAPTSCRGAHDAAGSEGLDARVLGLFGSPAPQAVVALPGIAADAASLLNSIQLVSTLTVGPGSGMDSYTVTHTLNTADFGPGWQVPVALASLGLPTLEAVTSATVTDGELVIGPQAFTLRLGTAARAAFGQLSLQARNLPADVPSFVSSLFALAQSADGSAAGCAALDGLVCPAAGAPTGCVLAACTAGLTALASKLDGTFAGADGTGLDFSLSGSAPLVGSDGVAERLGAEATGSSTPATWSVTLRTSLGSAQVNALFEGVRN